MPMFFFISGFFYRNDYRIDQYIIKKAKSLLIPYISFGVFYYVSFVILNGFDAKPLIHLLTVNTDGMPTSAGALWFLTALFWADIIYFLFDRWNIKWLIIPLVLVGSISEQVFPYPLPWALSASFVGMGLYWFGEISKKYEDKLIKLLNMNCWQILVVGVVITGTIFLNGYINMRGGRYAFIPLFWINALLSIYLGISISKLICKTNQIKWLIDIGKNSIVYVCLNQVVIRVFIKVFDYFQISKIVSHLCVLVFTMLILLFLSLLFTRTKFKLFIGR